MARSELNISLGLITQDFERQLKGVNRRLRGFQRDIQSIGQSLTTSMTVPLAAIGAGATKVFADFELSMAKVQAVSGATGKEFEKLRDTALELGRTTQFTASQVSELQLNLSKLGFSPTEINQSTAAILDLALATGEDLADSAAVAASTLRGFGLSADEMIRVTDVMADSFSSTALDLSKFSTAMAIVAPVANQAGASIEETTAFLGALVNRGVDASSAGSALRNIFLDIADKGLTLEEAMNKVTSSANPLATAMELFGKRGATVATIIANNREEISALTADFRDAKGETRAMASIMEDTLTGALNELKSAVEGAGISMGGLLAPTIRTVAEQLNAAVTSFNNLDDGTKKVILRVAAFAAAMGPALFTISKLIALRQGINTALLAMNTAFKSTVGALVQVNAQTGKTVLNFKSLLSPQIVAITAVVGAAALVWGEFKRRVDLANAAQNAVKDVTLEAEKALAAEEVKVGILIDTLKDENATREQKRIALSKLQAEQPGYFDSLDVEKSKVEDITAAYEDFRKSILLQAQAQAAVNKLTDIAGQRIEKLQEQEALRANLAETTSSKTSAALGIVTGSAQRTAAQLNRVGQELESLDKQNAALLGILKEAETGLQGLGGTSQEAAGQVVRSYGEISDAERTLGISGAARERAKASILAQSLGATPAAAAPVPITTAQVPEISDADIFAGIDAFGELAQIQRNFAEIDPFARQQDALKLYNEQMTLAVDAARVFGVEGGDLLAEKLNFTKQALQGAIEQFGVYSPEVAALKTQYEELALAVDANNLKLQRQNELQNLLSTAIGTIGENFAGAIQGVKSFGDAVKQSVADIIGVLIKQFVARIITGSAERFAFLGPLALPIAAAAGTAASALFKRVVGLEEGGIIPPGFPNDTFPARLTSGEAVIPLDKLPGLMGDGGQQVFIPSLTLRGEDLVIAFNRAQKNYNRYS